MAGNPGTLRTRGLSLALSLRRSGRLGRNFLRFEGSIPSKLPSRHRTVTMGFGENPVQEIRTQARFNDGGMYRSEGAHTPPGVHEGKSVASSYVRKGNLPSEVRECPRSPILKRGVSGVGLGEASRPFPPSLGPVCLFPTRRAIQALGLAVNRSRETHPSRAADQTKVPASVGNSPLPFQSRGGT
eukprot:gene31994-33920_t